MASADLEEKLICSVCLKFCESPIRLRCGHSSCRECIDDVLVTLEGSGDYLCPECKDMSEENPILAKKQLFSEDRRIFCTDCTFSPLPAVISCLYCEASLCDKHLRVHGKSEEHVFTKLNFMCSTHKKAFPYYCNEDCICVTRLLCEEHQGHQMDPLSHASEKEKLRDNLEKLDTNKMVTEERIENLQKYLRGAHEEASGVAERVVALFRDTRRQLDVLEDKILKDIASQEEQARASVCELIHDLEVKVAQLSRDIKATKDLCAMTEPLPVLQRWESIKTVNGDIEVVLEDSVSDLDVGLIAATLHTALSDIITSVRRGFYVQQTPDIVLNVDTASNDIHISSDLKSASGSEFKQNHPKLQERFQYNQVLSTRSFPSGRHFLEVETCHSGNWRLGMSYASIARKGYHSLIGHSHKSWGLCRYLNQYFVVHDRKVIPVPHKPSSQRLGIFLEYEAGHIGFYELCDPVRHLYTYSTKFDEALYLILGVYTGWVRIRN